LKPKRRPGKKPELPIPISPYQLLYRDLYCEKPNQAIVRKRKFTSPLTTALRCKRPGFWEILQKYNVKATFFVVGNSDEASKEIMRQIVAKPQPSRSIPITHEYKKIYAGVEDFLSDFEKMHA
jgi:hypothetical protein